MDGFNVYKDINARTNGEIYLGVVGPVRTGKSTFIRRFMETLILPKMDEYAKKQTMDEMPISGQGKMITTVEPKFIPKETVNLKISDDIDLKVRMIDCVGYMVNGAVGHLENDQERLVKTPWFDYEIPFSKAAEIGTKKVINDHSTIGIVITTDGSFGQIPREDYVEAEDRTIGELKALRKPFVVLLNSSKPFSQETAELANELSSKHNVNVLPINCEQLKVSDINKILEAVLTEFPVTEIAFNIPKWAEALNEEHPLKEALINLAKSVLENIDYIKDIYKNDFPACEYIKQIKLDNIDMALGKVNILIDLDEQYYYNMLSEIIGSEIRNEYEFINIINDLAEKKREYEQVAEALNVVKYKGYGTVTPNKSEIKLEKPEIIKHGNKYGVKIKAQAPSIHMIRANISTEIAPIVGSEEQANDLIKYIEDDTASDPDAIWNVNIFGKTLEQLVSDGMKNKATKMNDESQLKLQETMEKIINESNGGLVCIII